MEHGNRSVWRSLVAIVTRRKVDRDLEEELRDHLERDVAWRVRAGVDPAEARRLAMADLGGVVRTREEVRDVHGITRLEDLARDVRFAFRRLRRDPRHALLATLTLGIGIGAATAVFSAVDGVLLKPLPFRSPDELVMVWHTKPREGLERLDLAPGTFLDLQERARDVVRLAASNPWGLNFTSPGITEHLEAWQLTEGFLELVGVAPHLGRAFEPRDFQTGAAPVVLLDHGFWQRRFGGDAGIIGRQLRLDGNAVTVIGVMPPGFALPVATNLWTPWIWSDDQRNDRFASYIRVYGRLQPGATLEGARVTMATIAVQLAAEHPRSNTGVGLAVERLEDYVVGSRRPLLWTLLGAAAILVLVTLANVGALQLTRLGRQRREAAVRAALGASGSQLVRPLVAEALVLAALGGALGLALGWAGVRALLALGPQDLPRLSEIQVDWRAAMAAAVLCLLATVALAMPSVLRLARERASAGRTVAGSRHASRTRRVAVSAQLALGLLLLIGTTLLVRSFLLVLSADRGYRTEGVLSFTTWVYEEYPDAPRRLAFVTTVFERLGALPGVRAVSMGSSLPLAEGITGEEADIIPSGTAQVPGEERTARGAVVWPTYFETLGMRLLRGRALERTDDGRGAMVVVVNEAFVRRFYPGEDPIGRTVSVGLMGRAIPRTIVGVVGDTRHVRLDAPPEPAVYIPWPQMPLASLTFVLRTDGDPASLAAAVTQAMFEIDPRVGVARVATLEGLVDQRLRERRFMLTLLGAFAVAAVAIAVVGVFGVMSQAVADRTREIGVRMALGASPGVVLAEFLAEAGRTTAVGVAAGLGIAVFATGLLTRFLYGVARLDAVSVAVAVLLVSALAALAAALPSWRAARINPARVLQEP
ncbi:MAG TPA: ABC transporter permease [Gemmatimonadaceae bacterium]|nr:ABC transporter permease [Gemmatimonadaceae bacterium]